MAAANFLWLPFLNNRGSIQSSKNNTEYNPREHVIYLISLPLRNLNPEPSSSPSSNRLAYNSLVLRSNINSEQRSALTSLLANACRHENPAIIKKEKSDINLSSPHLTTCCSVKTKRSIPRDKTVTIHVVLNQLISKTGTKWLLTKICMFSNCDY